MLERLFERMDAKCINITSGIRCPQHSVAVGGYSNDMHTLSGACDIQVVKKSGGNYTALTIAEQAEAVGFNGIGLIDDITCHVDIRGIIPYKYNHWFGDERDSSKSYPTFKGLGEPIETSAQREIKVIIELEDKKYSGLLTEI